MSRRTLLLETFEDRILCSASPHVTVSAPATPKIGEKIPVTVSFDNASGSNPGFGPYVDLVLDHKTGVTGSGGGVDFVVGSNTATYLGTPVTVTKLTFDASGQAVHPYAKTASGAPLVVNAPAGYGPGDTLLVLQLPFGSFTPNQPAADITLDLTVSNLAELNKPLGISARGGFQYGNDALDNSTTDPSLVGAYQSTSISPQILTLTKAYLGPEDETATGPNYIRQYQLDVDIAPGQTLTSLQLSDLLPSNMQFVNDASHPVQVLVHGAPTAAFSTTSTPSTSTPGGTLDRTITIPGGVTGDATGAADATLIFSYFVPRIDSGSGVIVPANTGAAGTATDTANAQGIWNPIDAGDPQNVTAIAVPATHTLNVKSIATQKSVAIVNDTGATGVTPGDTLEYTIQVQVSDYFAFQNLNLADVISDGQRLDATFTPTFSWTEHGATFAAQNFNAADYVVTPHYSAPGSGGPGSFGDGSATDGTDGTTAIAFNISNEMIARGQDGKLIGGGIPNGGTGAGVLPNNPALPFGATTVTIKFRTVIQNSFSDDAPSGNAKLNPRDVLTNTETVSGAVLQISNVTTPTGFTASDNSGTSVAIINSTVSKSIYAINGSTNLAPYTGPGGQLLLKPGDTITYRLTYDLPTGDVENLKLTDFMPLPVLDATEITSFDDTISAAAPAAGHAKFGPSESIRPIHGSAPMISTDAAGNSILFDYGTTDNPANTSKTVDILFTATVGGQAFADGLFLTNQVQGAENNTQIVTPATSNAIVQFQIEEPAMAVYKGVVGYNTTGLTLGGIAFANPGAASSFTGTVSDATQAAAIGASDVASAAGLDAGDKVRYAIVAQNAGRKDAFDVSLSDAVPSGYNVPANLAAMNLVVRRGDGTLLTAGVDYTASLTVGGALSVVLTDNYTAGNTGSETESGAVSRGFDANTGTAITNGSNSVVITYDLTLAGNVQPNQTITNTAGIESYSNVEGGTDFLPGAARLTDTATVTTSNPTPIKTIDATSEPSTGFVNGVERVAVGEIVRYRVTWQIPEGVSNGLQLLDALPSGMQFLNDGTATMALVSSGGNISSSVAAIGSSASVTGDETTLASINPSFVIPAAQITGGPFVAGTDPTINLGNVTNPDSDANKEFVVVEFNAQVLNTTANRAGTTLSNSATAITATSSATSAGALIGVAEPKISNLAKTITGTPPKDAGDTFTYQVTFSNTASGNNRAAAFDLQLRDALSSSLNLLNVTVTTPTGVTVTDTSTLGVGGTVRFDFDRLDTVSDIASGPSSVTVTITAKLINTTFAGDIVANTATLNYSSLPGGGNALDDGLPATTNSTPGAPGTANGERNGTSIPSPTDNSGPANNAILNNYSVGSVVNVTLGAPTVDKRFQGGSLTADDTSIATAGSNSLDRVVVGEMVTYDILVTLPEGTTQGFRVRDLVPPGMRLDTTFNGGAGYQFIATAAASSGQLAADFSDPAALGTPALTAFGGTLGSDGVGGELNFGDVAVTADNNANNNAFIIRVRGIVDDVASNRSGTALTNSSDVIFTSPATGQVTVNDQTPNDHTVTVTEPTLTIAKSVSAASGDAGDPLTYTVTFQNPAATSGADAYGVKFGDNLPADFLSPAILLGGGNFSASGFGSFTAPTVSDFEIVNIAGTNVLRLKPAVTLDMPLGSSVTLKVGGALSDAVVTGQTIANTATTTWTSTPGANPDQRDGSGIPSPTLGTPDPAVLDNYSIASTAVTTAVGAPIVSKSIFTTSEASTPSNFATALHDVAPGEIVTYRLTVSLPEGVTPGLSILDNIPAGMAYVSGSVQLFAAHPGGTDPALNAAQPGTGTSAFNGSGLAAPTVSAIGGGGTFAEGTGVKFDFGTITTAGDNDANNNTLYLTYQAVVLDVAGNTGLLGSQITRTNSVTFSANGGASAAAVIDPGGNTVTLIEPHLAVNKTIDLAGVAGQTTGDAGDAVAYKAVISHQADSAADSFDATFSDPLPPELGITDISQVTVTHSALGDITSRFEVVNGAGNFVLRTKAGQSFDLALGQTLTIAASGALTSAVTPNETIDSTAAIAYSGLPGDKTAPTFDPSADVATDHERAYSASADAPVTVPVATLGKTLFATSEAGTSGANVSIGETVTYALKITLPEGTTPSINLVDAFPAGMQFVSSSIVTTAVASGGLLSGDFAGTLLAPAISGGASDGDAVTFAFGPTSTTGDNASGTNSFVVLVTARVTDIAGNVGTTPGQTVLHNHATLDVPVEGLPISTTPDVDVTVVEPRLQIMKGVDDATPDIGQTLHYTLTVSHTATSTATAYDVEVRDSIPAGITLNPANIKVNGVAIGLSPLVAVGSDASNASLISFRLNSLAVGATISITYDATVSNTLPNVGTTQDNNARIYWDSLAANDGNNSVLTGTANPSHERDYGAMPGYTESPTPGVDDPAQDTQRIVVNVNAVTGRVYDDNNANGSFDAGDTGIGNVALTLTGTSATGLAINASTMTAADGTYSFGNLPAGTYLITETQPTAYLDALETAGSATTTFGGTKSDTPGSNTISAITIPVQSNTTEGSYDFGEVLPASLAGSVYLDTDNNGLRNAGETGLTNVPITLTGTDAFGRAVSLSGTTDASGHYSFTGLRPSTGAGYTVTEDDSALVPGTYLDGRDTPGSSGGALGGATPKRDALTSVVLAQNVSATEYNFAELAPASLSGSVYLDANGNATCDGGETGIGSVTVKLTGTDDLGNAINTTTTTNASGAFAFTNLRPGTYTLTETQPAGFADGGDALGTLGGTLGNDVLSNIGVTPGANGATYTFGEKQTGLSGTVFIDRNANGALDASEPGRLAGVVIQLRDSGGNLVGTTITAPDGTYSFGNIATGDYTVVETQPTGYGSSTANTLAVTVSASGIAGVNFGETTGSLAGTVYHDADLSGGLNAGDSGLSGVIVKLTGTDVNGASVSLTATSAADGSYTFTDLIAGTYSVSETQPTGYVNATNNPGTAGGTLTPPDTIGGVALGAAQNATGYNFGETASNMAGKGTIAGAVFIDADKNSAFDTGEHGLAGVKITLLNNLGSIVATTTSGPGGAYAFTNLAPGDYTIDETQPPAYGSSTQNTITPVTVAANATVANQNFGETYGSLSGVVYVDANNDALDNAGEAPVAGVTVTLTGTDVNGATVNRTATTAADGSYVFDQLLTGIYAIRESQPAQYTDGLDALGTAGGTLGNDALTNIGLGGGIDAAAYNFGERPAAISGRVFIDADKDGTIGAGEGGLGGVTLTLLDAANNLVATTTTAADGSYSFGGLTAGSYTVLESQPNGYGSSSPNTLGVALPVTGAGGLNFGETTASLAGRVYVDADASGSFTGGDGNLGGVTVSLTGTDYNGSGVSISTTTAADGTYIFRGLLAGNYTVAETQPTGYAQGADNVGSSGGLNTAVNTFSSIGLGAAVDATDYNFGERLNTPAGTGVVAGTVFVDANKNTSLEGGETGLGGVTITLRDNLNNVAGTTVTNPDGSYVFANVTPGSNYSVTVTPAAGYQLDTPVALAGIDVLADSVSPNHNFGETTGSLAGTVFRDDNNDGMQQSGEPGIAGAIVTLTGSDAHGAITPIIATTDANGHYQFTGLLSGGAYTINEMQPPAYGDGLDAAGHATIATGIAGNDVTSGIQIAAGEDATGYTFGETGSTLRGTVFVDKNTNGTLQAGEPGIGSVPLQLFDAGGHLLATTTSAADGTYSFTGLPAGTYSIVETQPAAYGSNSANTVAISVPGGATGVVDFAEVTGSISGTVWHDRNNNGAIDPGEPLLGGVTVTVTGRDSSGAAIAPVSTHTHADGTYTFTDLLAGTYTVTETQPAGYAQGRDSAGTAGANSNVQDVLSGIGLGGGKIEGGYLFGERIASDLSVTKTDNVTTAKPGQVLTYTITVSNDSIEQAGGVVVTDRFPADALQFISASNGGVYHAATGTITWDLGQMPPTDGAHPATTLTITARVLQPVPAHVGLIVNVVNVVDTLNAAPDPTPRNNTATDIDTLPAAPDLYVVKTESLASARVGQQITYTIIGGNAGNQTAAGVTISDMLPPGLRFVSASAGGHFSNGRVVWDIASLAPGETFSRTVTVVVDSVPAGGIATNTVVIADDQRSGKDPTPFNNQSSVVAEIAPSLTFAFDGFRNFSSADRALGPDFRVSSPDITRDAVLPLAPIYSGEADPGATLVVSLFNTKGESIGSQTVVVDSGGNWLASFPSTTMRDTPQSVQITQLSAPYTLGDTFGHNLRTYFSPALNPGHFFLESLGNALLESRPAPLLEGLGLENPIQLGTVKYGGELLSTQATASGY